MRNNEEGGSRKTNLPIKSPKRNRRKNPWRKQTKWELQQERL